MIKCVSQIRGCLLVSDFLAISALNDVPSSYNKANSSTNKESQQLEWIPLHRYGDHNDYGLAEQERIFCLGNHEWDFDEAWNNLMRSCDVIHPVALHSCQNSKRSRKV